MPVRCLLSADLSGEDIRFKRKLIIMKPQIIREMSHDELDMKLEELEKYLFDLRSQSVTEKLENSKAIINVRRDIARIKTIKRERELASKNI